MIYSNYMTHFFQIMMKKDGKSEFKIYRISMSLHFHQQIVEFQNERLFVTIFSSIFEIGFTSVNQYFSNLLDDFSLKVNQIYNILVQILSLLTNTFGLFTFEITTVFNFPWKNLKFFGGFFQHWKLGFSWWFWGFETKFGQKLQFLSENLVDFFNIGT